MSSVWEPSCPQVWQFGTTRCGNFSCQMLIHAMYLSDDSCDCYLPIFCRKLAEPTVQSKEKTCKKPPDSLSQKPIQQLTKCSLKFPTLKQIASCTYWQRRPHLQLFVSCWFKEITDDPRMVLIRFCGHISTSQLTSSNIEEITIPISPWISNPQTDKWSALNYSFRFERLEQVASN